MTTGMRSRRRFALHQFRSAPYSLSSSYRLDSEASAKKPSLALEKRDWEDSTCSVCMDYPHNAVLLLCSSHDKGCRPYMCGTSCRYSNCLDQFKKAHTKIKSPAHDEPWHTSTESEKCEVMELTCPLCRGQVKGMTVVEPAREYLNAKKRSCTHDDCPFSGTYKELRKHVKQEHPCARPHEVDPIHEQKWRQLEHERERDDVLSTIRSSMPGAMVMGDYVIEGRNHHGLDTDDEEGEANGDEIPRMNFNGGDIFNILYLLHAVQEPRDTSLNSRLRRLGRGSGYSRSLDEGIGIPELSFGVVSEGEGDDDEDEFPAVNMGHAMGRRRRRRRGSRRSDVNTT